MTAVLTIKSTLAEMSKRLERAGAITRGALVCAECGAEDEAVRMLLELDLDVALSEAQTLHSALALLSGMGQVQTVDSTEMG